jgi:hypothetical protein
VNILRGINMSTLKAIPGTKRRVIRVYFVKAVPYERICYSYQTVSRDPLLGTSLTADESFKI